MGQVYTIYSSIAKKQKESRKSSIEPPKVEPKGVRNVSTHRGRQKKV